MPFDTSDWLRCPELKILPPDIRGLWMDMLCYMWESVERGVMVKPNGEIYTHDEVIRLIGKDSSGSDTWLDKLIIGGVCAEREDGALYSRRMVRSAEISLKRREAGLKGGTTTKSKVFDVKLKKPKVNAPEETAHLFDDPPPLTPEQKAKAEKAKKYKYADFVTLTRDEYANLCGQFSEEVAKRMIEILDNYKGSKGKKYKSDYRAILSWVVKAYDEETLKYGTERNKTYSGYGTQHNQGSTGSAVQAQQGESQGGADKTQKNYSERF